MCLKAMIVKNKYTDELVQVPCGRCSLCIARRISGWSFRLMQQEKISNSAHFITLTYDTKTVPITDRGYMSITKRDLQLYFKRLRKLQDKQSTGEGGGKISYFAVGEYGSRTMRPHYHAIVFNASTYNLELAWSLDGKKIGNIHFGEVSGASIGYCMKYMHKAKRIPMHKNDDRQSEFGLMSKGLGKNYISDEMKKWHLANDERMFVNLEDGRKISMCRYYKEKIYSDEQRKRCASKALEKRVAEENKLVDTIGLDVYEHNRRAAIAADADRVKKSATRGDTL